MLEELFKKGYLNYEKLILENTKALGVTAEESVVLIHLLKENSLSLEHITNKLLMTLEKVDKIMSNLMERGFYEIYLSYDNGKGLECVSFSPLFEKLEKIIDSKEEVVDSYDISKANNYLSEKMNRILTASELEILQSLMLDDHYSYDDIVEACDYVSNHKRVLSLRTITQALTNKKCEVKPKKEMPQSLKDFYNKI